MFSMRNVVGVFACLLVACGGGGGGSSSGGSPTPPPPPGSFTLSASTAAFRAPQAHSLPPSHIVTATITGSGVSSVSASVPASATWLVAEVAVAAPNYTVTLRTNTTQRNLGTASTTVTVTTRDSAGTALVSHDIQVSYEIYQGIVVARPDTLPFVFGGPETGTASFAVNSPSGNYRVQTVVPWLTVPSGTQPSGTAAIGVNVATLAPGSYGGVVQFIAANDPLDVVESSVELFISPPTLSASTSVLVLGGDDGLGTSLSGSLDLSLNTGPNSWPWTAQVQNFPVPSALTTPVTSGTVSGTGTAAFSVNADRAQLHPGTHTGTLHFTTTIKGVAFTHDVPLTVNWESQRLVPRHDGLAFTSTPSRAPVARQVIISDSRGRTGIPWSAVADAQWLQVSPSSGVTGDTLTVTVTPGGLLPDSLYNGTIVLTSTNASIERPEAIRVALWKSSTNAVNVSRQLTDTSVSIVTNPVEPYVYTISRYLPDRIIKGQPGGIIRVYHTFTGDLLDTFPSGSPNPGSMTISSDGTKLFVTDVDVPRTIVLDALTGSPLTSYPVPILSNALTGDIAFLRMNGHPVLWPAFISADNDVRPVDVETGQELQSFTAGPGGGTLYSPRFNYVQVPSPDGQFMYTGSSSAGDPIMSAQLYFTVMGGGPRIRSVTDTLHGRYGGGVNDLCVAADNRVWHSVESEQSVPLSVYDAPIDNVVASIVMPGNFLSGNLICGNYGRNYVSIRPESNSTGSEDNIAMFDDAGTLLGTYRHGPAGASFSVMTLSGDGARIVWPSTKVVIDHLIDTLEISSPPQ